MDNSKYCIPVRSMIYFNKKDGGNDKQNYTEMMEVSKEQYLDFLKPYAEILAENFVNKLIKNELPMK